MYLNRVHTWKNTCPREHICMPRHAALKVQWENIRTVVACGMCTEKPPTKLLLKPPTYIHLKETHAQIKSLVKITEVKDFLFHINTLLKIIH